MVKKFFKARADACDVATTTHRAQHIYFYPKTQTFVSQDFKYDDPKNYCYLGRVETGFDTDISKGVIKIDTVTPEHIYGLYYLYLEEGLDETLENL